MSDFPTLSSFSVTEEVVDSWEEGTVKDPTIKNDTEGGYTITRATFTRTRKFFKYEFPYYTLADKNTLKTFESDTVVFGSNSFNWTNPLTNVVHVVRFAVDGGIVYKPNKGTAYWKILIKVEEV